MKKRVLVSFILLAAYSIGIIAFAFHSHQNTSEHVNCKICHVAGSSEKAITPSQSEKADTTCGFIQIDTDSSIFRFLGACSSQRAPPVPVC
jgi:hypothetical protein